MYAAIKNKDQIIFGENLEELLKLADESSNYIEIDENELDPSLYIIEGKILDAKDENDNEIIKAFHKTFSILEQLKQIDITVAPRPIREFILYYFKDKFTEKDMKENNFLYRIYNGEIEAEKLREEIKENKKFISDKKGINITLT